MEKSINVDISFIKDSGLDDEYFFRQLVNDIVKEIPMNQLYVIFNLKKTDPTSDHSKRVLWDDNYSDDDKRKVYSLINTNTVLYEGSWQFL